MPGSHNKPAVSRRSRFHMHYAISGLAGRLCGMIPDCVLVANISCDLRCDLIHLAQGSREVRDPSSLCGKRAQCRSCFLSFPAVCVVEETDGVNNRSAEILHLANGLRQTEP